MFEKRFHLLHLFAYGFFASTLSDLVVKPLLRAVF